MPAIGSRKCCAATPNLWNANCLILLYVLAALDSQIVQDSADRAAPMKIKYGGWIFLGLCFASIYRVFPLGKSVWLTVFFVLSMLLHELGHALAAWYYRAPVHELGLCLWGGYIRYERPGNSLYHVVILTAGMLTNLLLAPLFWFLPHIGPLVSVWNLMLFASSVLPLPAFDGGKILRLCARQS